jgi:Tol biopolymer transport system component
MTTSTEYLGAKGGIRKKALALGLAAMMMTTSLLALAAAKPAQAAFPGKNGKIIFVSERTTGQGVFNPEGDDEIFTANPDGTELTQLTFNGKADFNPAWSADGKQIAFQSDRDSTTFNNDIFKMKADGNDQKNLTKTPDEDERSPTWSSSGQIAFVSTQDGNGEIYKMKADGSNQTRLTKNAATDDQPTFSPNGKQIAFRSDRDGTQEVYRMNADGSKQKRLTNNQTQTADQLPNWSPNGKQIAFTSQRDGNFEVYKMNADGSKQLRLTNNLSAQDGDPAWSPDGKQIAFLSNQTGDFEILKMDADGTNLSNVSNDKQRDFTPDWQPRK